ncbi:hypothetical protein Q9R46_03410 [Paenibacillus sp. RRE4]|uniref:hypothetical protein n=1 Tax=Paenibacillus sp. RRE4 TaxID=2962587 RepID=UPI0028828367|nr:hypothetical protein [Paenibacillus sp. RRE4]MDT0121673.1 hypothetical protein [Paenibacillus sp. RRE4]
MSRDVLQWGKLFILKALANDRILVAGVVAEYRDRGNVSINIIRELWLKVGALVIF